MFLLPRKDLERHRLMFKEKRLRDKSENKSQLIASTSGVQRGDNKSRPVIRRLSAITYNPFRDIIRFNGFEFIYDKEFLTKVRQLKQQLNCYVTEESRLKSRRIGHNIENIRIEFKAKRNDLLKKIRDNIISIDNDNLRDQQKPTTLKNRFRQTDKHSFINSLNVSFNQTFDYIYNQTNESDVEEDNGHDLMANTDQPMDTQVVKKWCQPRDLLEAVATESMIHTISWINALPVQTNSSEVTKVMTTEVMTTEEMTTEEMTGEECPKNCVNSGNNGNQSRQLSRQQLQITNRHKWTNTEIDPFSRVVSLKENPDNKVRTQKKRRNQLKFVLGKIYGLIESDTYCTKRDLYYQNVEIFDKSQRVVDEIVDDLACSLKVSRTLLHIVSSTRGLVFGHLKFHNTNGYHTDCLDSPNGINIPNDTERLSQMQSNAEFVLFVEKDATFQQLIDLKIHEKFPLIMITGVGYPCLNTRAFIQMLWNSFEIPIFGLVDGDPNGVEILCTIKHGSLALSYESANIVTPAIHWLGILPTDIFDFRLKPYVQIDLNERDFKKIEDLKKRPYMRNNIFWNKQLDIMQRMGKKVEIQSLNQYWPTFLLDVYLPGKLRYGSWV